MFLLGILGNWTFSRRKERLFFLVVIVLEYWLPNSTSTRLHSEGLFSLLMPILLFPDSVLPCVSHLSWKQDHCPLGSGFSSSWEKFENGLFHEESIMGDVCLQLICSLIAWNNTSVVSLYHSNLVLWLTFQRGSLTSVMKGFPKGSRTAIHQLEEAEFYALYCYLQCGSHRASRRLVSQAKSSSGY